MYTVIRIDNESNSTWQDLMKHSMQVTPFHEETYLQAVGFCGERYIVKKKSQTVAGLLVAKNRDGKQQIPSYTPYQGILFQEKADNYRARKEQLEAITLLLEELDKDYTQIWFSNHFSVTDMRAFLWHHYHEPEKGLYKIGVQYTATKNISYKNSNLLVDSLSSGRKLDLRYSQGRYGLIYEKTDVLNEEIFLQLYRETFARQNLVLNESQLLSVKRIIDTTLGRSGFLRYAVTPEGKRIDAIYVLVERDTAYYLFGANHPEYRKCGGGTFLLVEAMKECADMGVKYFDFVGINSPYRGDFKLSFGAEIRPYYICEYNSKKEA